jgi:putative nucleotidyltransferase with HDIG domain
MIERAWQMIIREMLKVRPGLIPLVVFTILLGVLNSLVVNQRVMLYIFYVPVVFAAWMLPKRDAVGVALLAGMMVLAYALYIPNRLSAGSGGYLVWTEIGIWGGILIVTAYVVSTLRVWTQEALANLQRAYAGVLSILSKFIETVDADTEAHSVRVSAWSVRMAEEMGLKGSIVEEVRIASMLHDVGKVEVSVDILRKAASLSAKEQTEMQQHTSRGAEILKPVGGMLSRIADAIESHHEKYDGSGYRGLMAEEIPLASRIIAVADAFDAMLSDRPYRKGMAIGEAMDRIISGSEKHFDPKVVVALQRVINSEGEAALGTALRRVGEIG